MGRTRLHAQENEEDVSFTRKSTLHCPGVKTHPSHARLPLLSLYWRAKIGTRKVKRKSLGCETNCVPKARNEESRIQALSFTSFLARHQPPERKSGMAGPSRLLKLRKRDWVPSTFGYAAQFSLFQALICRDGTTVHVGR